MDLKKTPLHSRHQVLGAKLAEFGGWEMPIQYTSIIDEHLATRSKAGLFDVSHMGEILVSGSEAKACVNRLISNDLMRIQPKKILYSPVCNPEGGVVDDVLVYVISDEQLFIVVNASNCDKDFAWFQKELDALSHHTLAVENISGQYGQIALQGPLAQPILQQMTDYPLDTLGFFFFEHMGIDGAEMIVSRTGYTGEDGFELYCTWDHTPRLWDRLLEMGKPFGLVPVGLGARDTLRFEAALPLYGHELSEDISPLESGLKYFVKLDKEGFIGQEAIQQKAQSGSARRLIGVELAGKGVPRVGYRVMRHGEDIGYVTSGTFSPTFKKGLAMALVTGKADLQPGDALEVLIRDRQVEANVAVLPFYRKKTKPKK